MFYLKTIKQLFLFVEQSDQLEVCLPYSKLIAGIPILAVFQNLRWNLNKTYQLLKRDSSKEALSSASQPNPWCTRGCWNSRVTADFQQITDSLCLLHPYSGLFTVLSVLKLVPVVGVDLAPRQQKYDKPVTYKQSP